jgi:hypothetical protein
MEIREWQAHQTERRRQAEAAASRQRRQRVNRRNQPRRSQQNPLKVWLDIKWAKHWRKQGLNQRGTTWSERWPAKPRRLYEGLKKPQATALFLLRTEAIGLNKWLAARRVPGVDKACPCGWHEQSVHHTVFRCPRYDRTAIGQRLRTENLAKALGDPDSAGQIAKWLIRQGVLQQFSVARDLEEEDRDDYHAVAGLSTWT